MPSVSESKMNLSALQLVDPNINEIVDSATQVALFQYSPQTGQWSKTQVEGALFIYALRNPHQRGLIILNRLSPKNYQEPITTEIEFKLNVPFLIYKNATGSIYGAWFYVKEECQRVGGLCCKLVSYLKKRRRGQQPHPAPSINIHDLQPPTTSPGRDIMSLLAKAGGEKDITPKKPLGTSNRKERSAPVTPGVPVVHRPVPTKALPPSVEQLFQSVQHQPPTSTPQKEENPLDKLLRMGSIQSPEHPLAPPMNNCMAEIISKLNCSAQKVIAEQNNSPPPPAIVADKKVHLITPEMLEESLSSPLPHNGAHPMMNGGDHPTQGRLSKGELKCTLVHLLQHDDDFLSKIHSAYTQSCRRKLVA